MKKLFTLLCLLGLTLNVCAQTTVTTYDIEDEKSLTNEELLAEIGKIDTWMKETKEAVATVLQPGQDVTYLLTNPDFTGNANGWTRVAASGGKVAWGSNCYEAWNNSNFDIYQEVNDAPVGVYSISVQGFYRYGRGTPAWDAWNEQESQYVKSSPCFVYLNDFQAPIMNVFAEAITDNSIFTDNDGYDTFDGYYAPNNMATATDCFAADSEVNPEEKMFTQKALGLISNVGDILRVGVKGSSNQLDDSWVVFDNFKLTYMGNDLPAIKAVLDPIIYEAKSLDGWMGKSVYAALHQAIANAENPANTDAALAALKDIVTAVENAKASMAKFDELRKALEALNDLINSGNINGNVKAEAQAFITDTRDDADDHIYEDSDIPELLAQIAEFSSISYTEFDVTYLLTNPDFTGNANGWTRVAASGGKVAWGSNCYEAWNNSNFDIYQEVNDAPVGVYSISVQGFYRYGRGTPAWDAWNEQESQYVKSSPCFVYLNDFQAPIMNVFAEAITDNSIFTDNDGYDTFDGYYAPNNMATATDCFAADSEVNPEEKMFTQKALGLISNVGDILRVGVKGSSNQLDDSWVVFDNFKLTYMGNDLPAIKAVLDPIIYEAKSLDGWMGKSVYAALHQAIANAENPANTDAALAALKDIVTAVENAKASMAKFDELRKALEALNDLINSGNINGNVKAEAQAFITDTRDDADDHIYEDSDIPELLAQIAEFSLISYTEFDEATGTLTYYYDDKKASRTGITELYTPEDHDAVRFTGYYKKVLKAVIDPSMKNAHLTSTYSMFFGGVGQDPFGIYALENMTEIDGLENLNTSAVTDMESMFFGCYALTQLDLSSFNTSSATNLNGMFLACNKLVLVDISSFDISNVTDMRMMFGGCSKLRTICCFEDWSTTSAQSSNMFISCSSLVGGNGTAFDSHVLDATYARPDGGTDNPGYFTADTMTGISLTEEGRSQMEDGAIYNLAGQKIVNGQWSNGKLPRGIYIVGGKKIIKK